MENNSQLWEFWKDNGIGFIPYPDGESSSPVGYFVPATQYIKDNFGTTDPREILKKPPVDSRRMEYPLTPEECFKPDNHE
jgi:hypothetical protein